MGSARVPTFSQGTAKCLIDEPFLYNGEWDVLAGEEYFHNGDLKFPETDHVCDDQFYRTVFGPSVAHNAVMFERSDRSVALALRRMTGCREPLRIGYHQQLRQQQSLFVAQNTDFFARLRDKYTPHFDFYLGLEEEAREHHADPHPKAEMRKQAWAELNETGVLYTKNWLGRSQKKRQPFITGKAKPMEYAKPGKKPRLIGDFGVQASLAGFRAVEFLKQAQADTEFEINGGLMIFVKDPSPRRLQEVFQLLANPPGRFVHVFFSDDAVLSYRCDGKIVCHNLDISSCDSSHTPSLFGAFLATVPEFVRADFQVLVDQCKAPIRIRSRVSKATLLIKPKGPKLFSGSTITTAINNLASMCIMLSISQLPEIRPEFLAAAAERAGYIITGCEPLRCFEELQFLKHSPVWDGESWQPMINFGVFLRASGTCKGDLPGKGDLEKRARQFQEALVRGIFSHYRVPILSELSDAGPVSEVFHEAVRQQHEKHIRDDRYLINVSDDAYFKRYNLNALDWAELREFVKLRYEERANYGALDKILALDYQLHTTTLDKTAWQPRFQSLRPRRA